MNSKFFDVNKDKQDSIINAALKLFYEKGYKDASTDVIVKQAGISKGLLFHYFISKQGLYEFICSYSTKYMILELTRTVKENEKDFFGIMSQIEMAKMRVSRNYPYMQSFLRSLKFEKDAEAITAMGNSIDEMNLAYSNIYAQINPKKFINPEDCEQIIKMIEWINDGFMKEELSNEVESLDAIYDRFAEILSVLRKHFYRSEINDTVSIAKEELFERNETVMDDLKMEMTFEERLMAGKRPLVELPPEEETESVNEDKDEEKNSKEENDTDNKDVSDAEDSSTDDTEFFDEEDAIESEADTADEDTTDAGVADSDIQEDSAEENEDSVDEDDKQTDEVEDAEAEEELIEDNNGITENDIVIAPTFSSGIYTANNSSLNETVNVPYYSNVISGDN